VVDQIAIDGRRGRRAPWIAAALADGRRLAWLACVEGGTLGAIKTKMGLGQRALGAALARALEDIANAYER